eukprot:4927620-Pleurochrysis_carterae.AAC.1
MRHSASSLLLCVRDAGPVRRHACTHAVACAWCATVRACGPLPAVRSAVLPRQAVRRGCRHMLPRVRPHPPSCAPPPRSPG